MALSVPDSKPTSDKELDEEVEAQKVTFVRDGEDIKLLLEIVYWEGKSPTPGENIVVWGRKIVDDKITDELLQLLVKEDELKDVPEKLKMVLCRVKNPDQSITHTHSFFLKGLSV